MKTTAIINGKVETEDIIYNIDLEGKTYHDDIIELIKNNHLKSQMKQYIKAENRGRKAAWEMVRLIASMSEYIKEDFGSDYKFAEFMECSQATINKRKRLGQYAYELEQCGYTDTQGYEFLPLLSKAEEIIKANTETPEDADNMRGLLVKDLNLEIPPSCTQKQIRNALKAYTAYFDKESETAKIVMKQDVLEDTKPETSETDTQGRSLEDYDDTETEETSYIEYTLPWIKDGGLVDETVQVSDDVAMELAKAIMEIINKY